MVTWCRLPVPDVEQERVNAENGFALGFVRKTFSDVIEQVSS